MFCSKCGKELFDGVTTCPICEGKTENTNNNLPSFKKYVDAYIKKTTNFQSAQDLIKNISPWGFMGKAICISALIGLIIALIEGVFGYMFLMVILGSCLAFFVVPMASNSKYEKFFSAKIDGNYDINIANLCKFLDENLRNIDPNFNEWSLVESHGLVPSIENLAGRVFNEVTIGCEYGPNKKNLAQITIRNNPKSRAYGVSAGFNGFLLSWQWEPFFVRSCLMKTAPILHAAMEYYINYIQVK